MARAGIYRTEVARARNNLLAMGRRPSIDAIRIELGNTGSKTTIQRYLKEIEEEENGNHGPKVAASDAILELTTRLAEQLHQEADQQISVYTEKHKAEIADLNNLISSLRNEAASFRGQTEQLALDLAAEKAAHMETQNKLQDERLSVAQLGQRIQDIEALRAKEEEHRLSLEEKHRHAREALEHFRDAAKEQREQDHRQFEQQIQFLKGELRTAQNTLNTKQQELIVSHENNARLSSELKHSRSEFYRVEDEIRLLATAKEQLSVAELKNQQLLSQMNKATDREVELINENKINAGKLLDVTAVSQRLEAELMAANAVTATQEQILQLLSPHHNSQKETIDNSVSPLDSKP
ncbi:DNA-binding protein [Methylomonas sp. AM2-LC]|uniref:DNA-binding protein n=1 Tax=Methylomonas sp. AM2-LC TaxID=3153301 RepID=UPI00326582EB